MRLTKIHHQISYVSYIINMIILVGGEKGGSGKSCLAQNLAVFLQQKNRDILLLDADPTLSRYYY